MKKSMRGVRSGAAMLGLILAGAIPTAAQAGAYGPVLIGNGPSFCGPCEPGPTVTRAAPNSAVTALRYRWSVSAQRFELVAKLEVGFTDHQGELRFGLEQGPGSVDKVAVWVGDVLSEGFIFQTAPEGCGGPRLCPLPRRYHARTNATWYMPGQPVYGTVIGAARGTRLDFVQEEYVEDGEAQLWIPTGEPVSAEVDAIGQATVILEAASTGVYRVIARDRETGEESGATLFEVGGRRR